jgi:hypothetical protein
MFIPNLKLIFFCKFGSEIRETQLSIMSHNGPVCRVENSPEILLAYRAHLVMIVHKLLAADTWCKGVKKLPKFGMNSPNSRHSARA